MIKMKEGFVMGLLITISTLGFAQETTQVAVPIDKAITNSMDYLVSRLVPGSTVVVLNFTAPNKAVSDYVIEELTTYLVNDDNLVIVDRRNLQLLAQEVDFQLTGEVSDASAIELGHRLGAETIISGSLTPLGNEYRMRIQALAVESARVQGAQNHDIAMDRRFASLLGVEFAQEQTAPAVIAVEPEAKVASSWSNKLFYFGVRGGASSRFFTLSDDIQGDIEPNDLTYEAGVHLGIQFTNSFALQVEALMYTADKVNYYGRGSSYSSYGNLSFESQSLMVPVLFKLTARPAWVLLALFGGGYFTLPQGQLKASSNYGDGSFDVSIPFGVVGGVNLGFNIGPGALFLDARYGMELGKTSISDGKGNLAIYSRAMASFSLGYEIGIITRK
ncbi:MAG: hypothetical protein LBJ41_07245 [Treponema sp.]|jgi:hypothetical protein|nr:hypothetical protein [Treponema sp.]